MGPFVRRLITLVILGILVAPYFAVWQTAPAYAQRSQNVQSLEKKRRDIQRERTRLRRLRQQILQKEGIVTRNIVSNQQRLESAKVNLNTQKRLETNIEGDLVVIKESLDVAVADQQRLSAMVGKRLRSLYMGERSSFIHMLLSAGNLTQLLDRTYFKQRIITQDRRLIKEYAVKTQILENKKNDLQHERNRLVATRMRIEQYRVRLSESIELDRVMMQKLRTSRRAYEEAENQLEAQSNSIQQQIMSLTRGGGVIVNSTGRFAMPVFAATTSPFGYRIHPIFRTRRLHSGQDFGARHGTPIRAADGGRVIVSGWQGGYGKTVIINHGSQGGRNLTTLYGHMSRIAVGPGNSVSKGQVIGYVGSTGYSTGAHLHFEVRVNGRPVNPMGYLR